MLPDDTKPLPGSMGTYKLIQLKLASCSTCIPDLNVRLFFFFFFFFFQCVKCACMWTHIYVRPHITFPHKVTLRLVVHVFQIILLTILYLFVCACLSVGNSQIYIYGMMTSANGNIFRATDHLCGEFPGHRWIPGTRASGVELWCFLWSAPE